MLSAANTPGHSRLTALRLVWSPWAWENSKPLIVMVAILLQTILFAAILRPGTDGGLVLLLLLMPLVAGITAATERAAARPLGFVKRLPLSTAQPKWSMLGPLCVMAAAVVVAIAATYRVSLLDTVSLIGMSWWAVAIGHWLAPRRLLFVMFLMPLTCWLGAAACGTAHDYGGPGAAAFAAVTLAAAGLLASPREMVFQVAQWRRGRRAVAPPTAASRRSRRAGGFVTAMRIWFIATPRIFRYSFSVAYLAQLGLLAANAMPGMSFMTITLIMPLAGFLAGGLAPAALGFLRTRPLTKASLLCGTILPPALLVISLPLVSIVTIQETRFVGPQAAFMQPAVRRADRLFHLRHAVGATFLPARVPAAGLSAESWPMLRSLLVVHACRDALLSLTLLFAMAGLSKPTARPAGVRWRVTGAGALCLVVTLLMVAPCLQDLIRWWHVPWPPPPLWLTALWVAVTAVPACILKLGIDPGATMMRFVTRRRAQGEVA